MRARDGWVGRWALPKRGHGNAVRSAHLIIDSFSSISGCGVQVKRECVLGTLPNDRERVSERVAAQRYGNCPFQVDGSLFWSEGSPETRKAISVCCCVQLSCCPVVCAQRSARALQDADRITDSLWRDDFCRRGYAWMVRRHTWMDSSAFILDTRISKSSKPVQ